MSPEVRRPRRGVGTAADGGHRRAAEIRAYPDGPFLVRGPVRIVDGDGRALDVRRAVVALCRCGRSRRQPLCDGTHTAAGFTCAGTAAANGNGSARTLDLRPEPEPAAGDAAG